MALSRTDTNTLAEATSIELLRTPEGRTDPYPLYHRLRDLSPVHHSDVARGWLLTGYDDCKAALRDPRLEKRFSEMLDARSHSWRERPALVWSSETLLNLDPPRHTRLRRRVFRSFTRGSVEALRPKVESLTDELLSGFASTGGDLMEEVAFPLPITVIGDLLGVPRADLPAFRDRTMRMTGVLELRPGREQLDDADDAMRESMDYFDHLIAAKQQAPGDDLISALVAPGEDQLTLDEVNNLAILLFVAGFETTTSLIGNGVLAFIDQPEQLTKLRDDPALRAKVPHELLRHSGTVQLVSRYAVEDVAFGDQIISAGDTVFPLIGAGNREPERYPNPDQIDLSRSTIAPLAFGGGIHHCLGAALAELEIEVVFAKIAERFDITDLSDTKVHHRDRLSLHTPSEVTVRLEPRERTSADLGARPTGDDSAWRTEFRARAEAAPPPSPEELTERVAILERIPLFAACTPSELTLLAVTAYPIAFDPGDVLILEGATSTEAYVITEGEVRVDIAGVEVATMGADEVVGERGPIEDRARSATVTAASQVATFALSRERLEQVVAGNPAAEAHMKTLLAQRYG